jgi:hypothetical protein
MYVHVDQLRRQVDVNDAARVASALEHTAVRLGDRYQNGSLSHRPTVDQNREPAGAGARLLGPRKKRFDP